MADKGKLGIKGRKDVYAEKQRVKSRDNPVTS